jgi:hypothetical protein
VTGAAPDVRGVWRLVAVRATDPSGAEHPSMYGPTPMGTAQFEGGRLTAVLTDGRRDPPAVEPRAFLAFSGPYEVADGVMTYRPDAASHPSLVGTEQPRGMRFEGQRLVLTPPPFTRDGLILRLDLEWERLA